jgi:cytochrome P450
MRKVKRAVEQMNAAVFEIIRQRRNGATESRDLVSILMRARDADNSAMTDGQLRDEVMTFLLAGHETTALALSWALYLLSRNPDAASQLHHEVDHVLGDRRPDVSDLSLLTFTENVLKETMRLYPPAWGVARTVIGDFDLAGYHIPAGANIVMSQWIMHHDSRFFSQPDDFNPDRWSDAACQNLPRFAYFPFGGGPRQCIGASFAMTEAILILTSIVRKYRLVQVHDDPILPVPSLTLRPKTPIRMRIEAR